MGRESSSHASTTNPTTTAAARRRADLRQEPRLKPEGRVTARDVGPEPVTVLALHDISTGGFAIATDKVVPGGRRSRFEFKTFEGLTVTLSARSAYTRLTYPSDATLAPYIAGWAFELTTDADMVSVDRLIDAIMTGITFG